MPNYKVGYDNANFILFLLIKNIIPTSTYFFKVDLNKNANSNHFL